MFNSERLEYVIRSLLRCFFDFLPFLGWFRQCLVPRKTTLPLLYERLRTVMNDYRTPVTVYARIRTASFV